MPHNTPTRRGLAAALAVALGLLPLAGCSTNPATGKQQLNLIGEAQEIQMGREYHEQVVRQIGLYPDEDLQEYVQRVGARLAADSERPELPWTFRVVDDAAVNAFALPGGFIYVTRGIMTHMGSEAELAGVLGPEIGHVTARHSVNQLSKSQLASIGLLGLGLAFPSEFRQYGDLAQLGLGAMFLKFGRDDERQADDLGLRYLAREGYPPQALGELFTLLTRVSQKENQGRLPNWLSTHPNPEQRRGRVESVTAGLPESVQERGWEREPYLQRLEGMVYGANPREGFFRDGRFYHPDLAFQIDGPRGWKGVNQKQAVVWQSPDQDALVALALAPQRSAEEAARAFFGQQGLRHTGQWVGPRGSRAAGGTFYAASQQQGEFAGAVSFVEHEGRVFQLLSYTRPNQWGRYDRVFADATASFERLGDRRLLGVDPMRVDLVEIDRSMTLRQFAERYPSAVPIDELALVNQVEPGTTLRAGQLVKRIVGFNPEG
jgi:predicted Zn-dependent protease